ncbi:MAG: SgcJ/EcaC family oxidoreductase [Phycisphaerales bacterium]|nr:SgcJ/EcaC family oxidoreductase [Hyphomonadaceae bacterium]
MSPLEVVERQVEAYNAQDLDAFCACFAEDCVIADLNGAVTQAGAASIRTRYAEMFKQYPQNRARIVNRIVVGDVVIDHEEVARTPGQGFEAAAIYTVKNGLIARVDFVK